MIAQVALPLPIDKLFSYAVPEMLAPFARPLTRVKVPFHNRSAVGYIIDLEDGDAGGLKSIQTLVDCVPLIDGACFELCKWASLYYAVPIGLALKYALSSTISIEKYCVLRVTDPALAHLDGLTLKKACTQTSRLRILEYLAGSQVELADPFTGGKIVDRTPPGPRATGAPKPTLFTGCVEERLDLYTSLIAEELGRGRSVLMLLPDYRAAGAYFYALPRQELPRSRLLVRQLRGRQAEGRELLQGEGGKGAPYTREQKLCLFTRCRKRPHHSGKARRGRVPQRGGVQVQRCAPCTEKGADRGRALCNRERGPACGDRQMGIGRHLRGKGGKTA